LLQGLHTLRLSRNESGAVIGLEQLPAIVLSCDATDSDNDGILDLPADGVSTTKITAKLGTNAQVEVTFRTTRGSLSKRTARTSAQGRATVELRATTETVPLSVTATAPAYRSATLKLEFIPPSRVES